MIQITIGRLAAVRMALVALVAGMTLTFVGGTAFASFGGPPVDELAGLRLTSTGALQESLRGFARLQLNISDENGAIFRASAQIESEGLIKNRPYDLWLADPEGNNLLIGTARAEEECEENFDTGELENCEREVKLRSNLLEAPLGIATLEGLTVNVSEHVVSTINPQNLALVLATGTVTQTTSN